MRKTKVLIAGAGPAGAATALSLSNRGISCLLVEQSDVVVFKAGETIAPNASPLLHKLGIADLLSNPRHLVCYGNRFIWGDAEPTDKDFLFGSNTIGHHIDRMHFEEQMHSEVRSKGIKLLTGWTILNRKKESRGWTVITRKEDRTHEEISCEFIVDATGRRSRIARAAGITRHKLDNLIGIAACFSLQEYTSPHYTYIEATENGWWYAAPLTGNRVATTFMTDSDLVDPLMLDTNIYLQSLQTASLLSGLLTDFMPSNNVKLTTCSASTSYLSKRYGEGWLAVGDAAFAFDPISSYGITSALEGGYYAGHAIADMFGGFNEALPAYDWLLTSAFAIYKEMHTNQYLSEQRWPGAPFWKRRMIELITV